MKKTKVAIIGSGPSGYTAAIYAARANLAPILYAGFASGPAGGQLMTTTEVENFPGFPDGISGPLLMENCRKQAERFGTEVLFDDVIKVDLSQHPFKVSVGKESNNCIADSIIISTGAVAKRLDIPGTGDDEFWQKGVTACAVCDGAMPIFRNKDLYVIGGGDSAVEEATFLTKYGKTVYIVHRRDELRASKILQQRALNHPKVEILWNSEVVAVEGDDIVRSVTVLNHKTNQKSKHEAGGLFFAVGHIPNTAFLNGQIELHDNQYIKVVPGTCKTSVRGVFAAGDVQDFVYRQAVTAAGSGCMAALEVEHFLNSLGSDE
jgi:thioredoxin reductase (NADPH)